MKSDIGLGPTLPRLAQYVVVLFVFKLNRNHSPISLRLKYSRREVFMVKAVSATSALTSGFDFQHGVSC